ncbi:hypothetical protein LTS18_008076 [Coniosporium uncinatum]|uniref:Uncharacterized protein n=1 Tax=Coniosporium uncinatum TaxID=93489 RepID=A0ACC3DWW0_9PEZI|nr:hypothetical protein LTS18_008076 [Coniosporium uncinatum]
MWGGPIHNPAFIEKILSYLPTLDKETYPTIDRMEGMLQTAYEETELYEPSSQAKKIDNQPDKTQPTFAKMDPTEIDHHPFYFSPSDLAKHVHCQAPAEAMIRGALRHAGYRAARSHAVQGSIKTDAPWGAIWHIMREWVRQKAPVKEGRVKEGMAGFKILQQMEQKPAVEPTETNNKSGTEADGTAEAARGGNEDVSSKPNFEVVFDEKLGRDKQMGKRLKRYQLNPRENWGPMARAK